MTPILPRKPGNLISKKLSKEMLPEPAVKILVTKYDNNSQTTTSSIISTHIL